MSPVTIEHQENSLSCHHCHINDPIPLSQLIKTHPLRAPSPDGEDNAEDRVAENPILNGDNKVDSKRDRQVGGQNNGGAENDAKGDIKFRADAHPNNQVTRDSSAIENGTSIQSLLCEIVNHEFHRERHNSLCHYETSDSNSGSLRSKEDSPELLRPVHSFLHHESKRSIYKAKERESSLKSLPLNDDAGLSRPLESALFHKSPARSSSPELILNPKTIHPFPEYAQPIGKGSAASQYQITSPQENSGTRERDRYSKIIHIKDTETQTSKNNTLSGTTLRRIRACASQVSSVLSHKSSDIGGKKCRTFACTLPSGLLFAGYSLLIVIGIVVAVALSQRERRIFQSSVPRGPPPIPGARAAPIQVSGPPRARIVSGGSGARRRSRPIANASPFPSPPSFPSAAPSPVPSRAFKNAAPPPPARSAPRQAPRPAPRPAPTPQTFTDQDFDYIEDNVAFEDSDFLLPAQKPVSKPAPNRAPAPQQRASAPSVSQPRQQQPRRSPQPSFRQEFNLQPQVAGEDIARGSKEPDVQIIKSWSNRNSDGTFSWGYLNTDGTFKNETKGIDCVVRGVYGYIDETTGETVSYPYESGNPCDPNAPDYYFDYEDGTINSGGAVVSRPQLPSGNSRRRLQ